MRIPGDFANHTCDAAVVTCIDFRFQDALDQWLKANVGPGHFDRIAYAGGVKEWETVMAQIRVSKQLHQIKKVILINHEGCGAYGSAGTLERHQHDLTNAKQALLHEFPDLTVELYYAQLDGNIVPVAAK